MKFVKYTSLGLIIGFGGYACYRLIVKQRLVHHVKVAVPPPHPNSPFLTDPVEKKDSYTATIPATTAAPTPTIKQNGPITTKGATSIPEKDVNSSLPLPNHEIHSLQSSDTKQPPPKTEDFKDEQKVKESEIQFSVTNGKVEELTNENEAIEQEIETAEEPKVDLNVVSNSDLIDDHDITISSENELSVPTKKNSPKQVSTVSTDSPCTTNCSLEVCPSTPCSSPLDLSEYDGELTSGSIDFSAQRSFSMTSQSSMLGEGMVAKLEQLLQEVGNIKESVGEINADFVTVRKKEPKLLTISADSISIGDETNGESMVLNGKDECSQTPSLEWDSNGINLVSDPDSNHSTIKEEDESLLSESLLSEKSELFSPISSGSLNSTAEPSLFITSFGDLTNNEQTDKEMSSLQFSTSDANDNIV